MHHRTGSGISVKMVHRRRLGLLLFLLLQVASFVTSQDPDVGGDSFIFTRLFDPSSGSTDNDTMVGRLEIYYNGEWGGVCGDGHFTDIEASVVCASLGFGRTGKYIGNSFGSGNGTIWFHNVTCSGNEQSIAYCEHPSWGSENYCFLEEVAISCDNSPVFVRLLNPNSDSTNNNTMEGRLEIYFNGVWGTVCDSTFDDAAAQVVCASLGFGRISRNIDSAYGPGNGPVVFDTIYCNGDVLSIIDCQHSKWGPSWPNCDHSTDVSISCCSDGANATEPSCITTPRISLTPTTKAISTPTTTKDSTTTKAPTTTIVPTNTKAPTYTKATTTNSGKNVVPIGKSMIQLSFYTTIALLMRLYN